MVNAGSASEVMLGGGGRSVVGTAVLSGATTAVDWKGVPVSLESQPAGLVERGVKREDFASTEAFIEADKRSREAYRSMQCFAALCDSDGSFRFPNVPAGTYRLTMQLRDMTGDSVAPASFPSDDSAIASVTRDITVPAAGADQPDAPFDIGTVELTPTTATNSVR